MSFLTSIHPETQVDSFSRLDGTITYFAFVKGAMKRVKAKKILDYGAGRGAEFIIYDDHNGSLFLREQLGLHKILPNSLATWLCLFIRKRG